MNSMLIDAHTHLDHYEECLDSALEEIERHRILSVSTAMGIPGYKKTQDIGRKCVYVIPCFGIHPWNAHEYADRLDELAPYIQESPLLGEIGLDFHFVKETARYPRQEKVLRYFLRSAQDQKKSVNLHTKGAEREILALLEEFRIPPFILHWYSGPLELVEGYLEAGAFFTVGVAVLNSPHIARIVQRIPKERLLTETDNPGALQWQSRMTGMSAVLIRVVHKLAEIRQSSCEELIHQVGMNFLNLIGSDHDLCQRIQKLDGKDAGQP
jgi:TatD DNase family protein